MAYEIVLTPRARKSPFFSATVASGVTAFSVYNHTYFPLSYGSMEDEYWRLINNVAVWDVACQRQIELRGPDASALTQLLCTRDLTNTDIGQGRYAPMCDHAGRLLNDPLVLRVTEDQWWLSMADSDMLSWCRAIAAERGFDEVLVTELDVAPLAVQGLHGEDTVAALLGEWVRRIRFFRYEPVEIDGIKLMVGRAGYSAKGGFELYLLDPERGVDLWNLVLEAGRPFGIGPGTPNHMERVESAFISIRTDTDDDTDPFEVRLGRYVSFAPEIDYIGKAALAAKRYAGLRRELVGLIVDGTRRNPNQETIRVTSNDEPVGVVRSMVWSPRLETMIALAMIDVPCNEPGSKVTVEADDGPREALVTELPFI